MFVYGEPPFYAQVKRDGASINLRCVDRPVIDPELRDKESLLSAAMTVATADEIKQLFLEFQSVGVEFNQTLKREPWGARNFIVKDPDGNLRMFAAGGLMLDRDRMRGYCSNRSTNQRKSRVQTSSLPTWSSMPCSRFGLSLTSITMKPESVCLISTP